ncbi:hypothetical protein DNK47_00040 [Mycoplasma wenyonii]|uniref:Uncharacterized protein n=1 Tax=Mycoplasma wenyonii TaxID=65123 RepID=A0A328PQU0_9MOLU|nr:hypothetical protein [Mycoplasma wenyonii]RAO95248.1 hypothetical protein DNK47_00040 [Mycoplasma wenyonii]
MPSVTLPALGLETQGIALPVSGSDVAQQTDTAVDSSHSSNGGQLFIKGINIPELKKYYKKLKRNIFISMFIAQSVFMAALWFIFVESGNMWGWTATITFSAKALESVKSSGPWAQVPISVGFGSFLLGSIKNLFRLSAQKKRICWECDLCQSGRYPTSLTPALSQKILTLFAWRINGFWVGFTIAGLGVVAGVYGYFIRGFHDSVWKVEWERIKDGIFKWQNTAGGKTIKVSVLVGLFGLLVLFTTNVFSRFAIKNALKIFDSDEMNMHPDIREKVFRLNKRNKIISTVILCVLGLAIFIILKRLIVAVFNRSFNVSKW